MMNPLGPVEEPVTQAEKIEQFLHHVKKFYPSVAPLVEGRLNHIKRRYAGIFAAAIVACEIVAQVLA